jgi:hypothetical protein
LNLVPAVEGTGLAVVSVGRGAAFGDIFNDGKMGVILNNMDGAPVLLRNVNPDHHQWAEMKLIGGPKSPRDAVGATVYLSARRNASARDDVLSGGSYLSSNDMRVHFGLGDATDAGTAEIHWPSGLKEMVKLPAVDQDLHHHGRSRNYRVRCATASLARLQHRRQRRRASHRTGQ